MPSRIVEGFEKVKTTYQILAEISEQQIQKLQKKDFEKANQLMSEQEKWFEELQQNLNELKKNMSLFGKEKGVTGNGYGDIKKFLEEEQIEKISQFKKESLEYEKKLKNNSIATQSLVEIMLESYEIAFEEWREQTKEKQFMRFDV